MGSIANQSDLEIRRGIEAEPDIHPTDEEFWKDAKLDHVKRTLWIARNLS